MPKLRARTVERNRPLDLGEKMLLSIGPGPGGPSLGSPTWRALKALWQRHGDPLEPPISHRRPGQRAWGFWAFEPAVPDDLRPSECDHEMDPDAAALVAHHDDLDARRLTWLRDNGHLEAHELMVLDRVG